MSDLSDLFFWEVNGVIEIHDFFINEYGGKPEFKDGIGSLESALERPKQYLYYYKYDVPKLAGVYAHSIAGGHVFTDGNKRTASRISEVFLIRNGFLLMMSNFTFENLILGIADGSLSIEYVAEYFSIFSREL